MKTAIEVYDYDVYPKVVIVGDSRQITIKGLGYHSGIIPGEEYNLTISASEQGDMKLYPEWAYRETVHVKADEDSALRFMYTFPSEQEYFIRFMPTGRKEDVLLGVYALAEDMRGRYPFRGDMHVHTRRSDGREAPEIVCSNYRSAGYDFMVVSDHERYYPSLEVKKQIGNVVPSFTIVPGEEVHLPLTDIHIVNFGGSYSINGLVEGNTNDRERGSDPSVRSSDGKCPDVLSRTEYDKQIHEIAKKAWFGAEHADISFAVCVWAFDHIRAGGGLGIFCHPYWRVEYGYQVPEKFIDTMLTEHPFDAFEVLGGESYFEHNGYQTVKYYEMLAKGINFPIVGSTDTHGSTEHNRNGLICSTIVFAPENTREALISSVRDYYSVAVDTISEEYRLVGSLRLQKYAGFLMKHFYPLHDRVCAIDGAFLRRYVTGDADVIKQLDAVKDDMSQMMHKYFAV